MLNPYQRCERKAPVGIQVYRILKKLGYYKLHRLLRKSLVLLSPLIIVNLILTTVFPINLISAQGGDTPPSVCRMEFVKTDSKDPILPGEEFSYTLILRNIGTKDCTGGGVLLKEFYDSNAIFLSSDPVPTQGNNLWNFGVVSPQETHEVEIQVKASNTLQNNDVITNRACFWTREYHEWV